MKKYIGLLILGLSLSCPVWAEWTAENCKNRGGNILNGRQRGTYCMSAKTMNWWSANVWCQKHGGQLVDFYDACQVVPGENVNCPNFYEEFWYRTRAGEDSFWSERYGATKEIVASEQRRALCE